MNRSSRSQVHRDTIMRLLILAGERCEKLMDAKMRNIHPTYLQCDEIWTFVQKKRRNVRTGDSPDFGDQWVFIAMDEQTKLIPHFEVGKRTKETTIKFLEGLRKSFHNVVFKNSVVHYSGGPTTLDGVAFVNCTFILDISAKQTPAKPSLLMSLLSSPSQTNVKIE
jgi:hypothetical protein